MSAGLIIATLLAAAVPQHTDHVARIGQTVIVDGPSVTPIAVLEDSRCPANARCIWAGQVRIRVRIGGGKVRMIKELTLGMPVPVADGALTLNSVSPERFTQGQLRSKNYRFGFRFAGGL